MKKYILIGIVLVASVGCLASCGGGKSGTTSNNNSSNSSSSSSIQISQGQVEVYNSATTSINEVAVLNINTVFDTAESAQIDSLEMCNDEKCWTLIDQSSTSQRLLKRPATQRLTENKSTQNIGSFSIPEEGITVDRLKYSYKGEDGEVKFENEMVFNKFTSNSVYLKVDEEINISLSSLDLPHLGSNLFLSENDFYKETTEGLIVDISKGSSQQSSFFYVSMIGGIKNEKLEADSYLINFYSAPSKSELNNIKNIFPNNFLKPIRIYLPITLTNITPEEIKDQYKLMVNDKSTHYGIVDLGGKQYIKFQTISSTIKVGLNGDSGVPE